MHEIDRNLPLIVYGFNEAGETNVVFQKRRFQSFISEVLRLVSLLGEKFICFQLP